MVNHRQIHSEGDIRWVHGVPCIAGVLSGYLSNRVVALVSYIDVWNSYVGLAKRFWNKFKDVEDVCLHPSSSMFSEVWESHVLLCNMC